MTVRPPLLAVVSRDGSADVVRFAAREARRGGRSLHLLVPADTTDAGAPSDGDTQDPLHLSTAEVAALGPSELHTTPRVGDLVRQVRTNHRDADLVVVVQPGPGRHRQLPAAVRLARAVDTPVAVVPAGWRGCRYGVVTVGQDPLMTDADALRAAVTLARLHHCALRVVVAGRFDVDEVWHELDAVGGADCDIEVEASDLPAVLALSRASERSDLLVLGRHLPAGPRGSRIGDVGGRLIGSSACPVLLTAPGHHHARPATDTAARIEKEL